MPTANCKVCGGLTNTTTCKWDFKKDGVYPDVYDVSMCFVKWVDDIPVKGCSYDKVTDKHFKKWIDKIIKKG